MNVMFRRSWSSRYLLKNGFVELYLVWCCGGFSAGIKASRGIGLAYVVYGESKSNPIISPK